MIARVNFGHHFRMFEALCRMRHVKIADIVVDKQNKLKPNLLPKKGGVYAFWWTGKYDLLRSSRCQNIIILQGSGGHTVSIDISSAWKDSILELPIPLYVGKNAENIARRVGQHLRLSELRMSPIRSGPKKVLRPTTTCQLRYGVDHLFNDCSDTRRILLDNIGISYVILDGNEFAPDRFYLEDLSIGLMHPPFNIDIER